MRVDSMSIVHIQDLELWAHIGITEEERLSEQRILATITLEIEDSKAKQTDAIEDTIDYEAVTNLVKKTAKGNRNTLEKLGADIVAAIQKEFDVENTSVELKKFILPGTEHVSVKTEYSA